MMDRSVDYDRVAGQFDDRYRRSDYSPVLRLLLDFAGDPASARILEVGCGTGQWLAELTQRGFRTCGLDPSRGMVEVARSKTPQGAIMLGRGEAIPCGGRTFGRLFCINSLHHFADKERFFVEASRVLSPGGAVLIVGLDPHNGQDRWWIYDYFPQVIEIDRKRYPSTQQMRDRLTAHGFTDCHSEIALHMPMRLPARAALESGRLDKTTTSQLSVLSDDEYRAGIRRLVGDIEAAEAAGETLEIGADLRLYATTAWIR